MIEKTGLQAFAEKKRREAENFMLQVVRELVPGGWPTTAREQKRIVWHDIYIVVTVKFSFKYLVVKTVSTAQKM